MVQHAYIAGKIETDERVLGDQVIAIVPGSDIVSLI
jgi:hypothetical protein